MEENPTNWGLIGLMIFLLCGVMATVISAAMIGGANRRACAEAERAGEAERQLRLIRLAEQERLAREAEERRHKLETEADAARWQGQLGSDDRDVFSQETRFGSYVHRVVRKDPSKRFLQSADRAVALCKETDLSSPGSASLHVGPGPEVIRAQADKELASGAGREGFYGATGRRSNQGPPRLTLEKGDADPEAERDGRLARLKELEKSLALEDERDEALRVAKAAAGQTEEAAKMADANAKVAAEWKAKAEKAEADAVAARTEAAEAKKAGGQQQSQRPPKKKDGE